MWLQLIKTIQYWILNKFKTHWPLLRFKHAKVKMLADKKFRKNHKNSVKNLFISMKINILLLEIMKAQMSSWNLTISVQCSADFAYATSNMVTVLFFISKNFTWTISSNINNDPWNEFRLFEKILITWKILRFKKCKMFDQYQIRTDCRTDCRPKLIFLLAFLPFSLWTFHFFLL